MTFGTQDYWDDAPPIAKGNYNLWRLMIDKNYQNIGYGKEALRFQFIREFAKSTSLFSFLSQIKPI